VQRLTGNEARKARRVREGSATTMVTLECTDDTRLERTRWNVRDGTLGEGWYECGTQGKETGWKGGVLTQARWPQRPVMPADVLSL
jgi:hypothetical protein